MPKLGYVLLAVLASPVAFAAQPEPMLIATVGDKPVAYHVLGAGTGTPVLTINGGPGFAHDVLHLSSAWTAPGLSSHPIVFFDQPGTGRSWAVREGDLLAVSDVLDGMEAVRAALGARRLIVLGHSWGGYLALAYAIRHPDAVESVVLVDSIAPKLAETDFLFGALFPDRVAAEKHLDANKPADVETWVRGRMAMSFYSGETRDRVLAGLASIRYNGYQERVLWKDAESRDLTADLSRLKVPVLIITGRFDANVAPRTAWRIHQAIRGSQFVVFERSGHFPMIEEPTAFAAVVGRFLAGQP